MARRVARHKWARLKQKARGGSGSQATFLTCVSRRGSYQRVMPTEISRLRRGDVQPDVKTSAMSKTQIRRAAQPHFYAADGIQGLDGHCMRVLCTICPKNLQIRKFHKNQIESLLVESLKNSFKNCLIHQQFIYTSIFIDNYPITNYNKITI